MEDMVSWNFLSLIVNLFRRKRLHLHFHEVGSIFIFLQHLHAHRRVFVFESIAWMEWGVHQIRLWIDDDRILPCRKLGIHAVNKDADRILNLAFASDEIGRASCRERV